MTTAAIVLAGGRSSRFGRDKASELLLGVPLLRRVIDRASGLVDECVVVRRAGQTLPVLQAPPLCLIEDRFPDSGPLGGLYTGLEATHAGVAIALACDMPLVQPALLEALVKLVEGYDAVVPVDAEGVPQPLCAAYRRASREKALTLIEAGKLSLRGLLSELQTRYLSPTEWRTFDPRGLSFLNLNTETDLRHAEALLQTGSGPM